jgi:hypothetical protein
MAYHISSLCRPFISTVTKAFGKCPLFVARGGHSARIGFPKELEKKAARDMELAKEEVKE